MAIQNTGYKGYSTLLKVTADGTNRPLDINNNLCSDSGLPQVSKANTVGQPDYVAPIYDTATCPITPAPNVVSSYYYKGIYPMNDRAHPNGGSINYYDINNDPQISDNIFLEDGCIEYFSIRPPVVSGLVNCSILGERGMRSVGNSNCSSEVVSAIWFILGAPGIVSAGDTAYTNEQKSARFKGGNLYYKVVLDSTSNIFLVRIGDSGEITVANFCAT